MTLKELENDVTATNAVSSNDHIDLDDNNLKKRTNEHLTLEEDSSKQPTKKRIEATDSDDTNTEKAHNVNVSLQSEPVTSPQLLYCQQTFDNVTSNTTTTQNNHGHVVQPPPQLSTAASAVASPFSHKRTADSHHSVLPLSMQVMKPFWIMCCQNCERTKNGRLASPPFVTTVSNHVVPTSSNHRESVPSFVNNHGDVVLSVEKEEDSINSNQPLMNENHHVVASGTNLSSMERNMNDNVNDETIALQTQQQQQQQQQQPTSENINNQDYNKYHHIATIPPTPQTHTNAIMQEYISTTQIYGCKHINAGVLTTIRFSLPTLRVSGSFHDSDMLALSEILFRHCNTSLKHIKRLDFSVASREGKLHGKRGFGSHGAFTLSRVLCISNYIEEVFVQRNRIGPYGAAAMFAAAGKNKSLKTLVMRQCLVGERGALAFAEYIGESKVTGLKEVDLSVNRIGFRGCIAIEEMLNEREKNDARIDVDLEGNLVLQEGKWN